MNEADAARIADKLELFHRHVNLRFDQLIELLDSGFHKLQDQIRSLQDGVRSTRHS